MPSAGSGSAGSARSADTGAIAVMMVLRASVARSASRLRKLCTGSSIRGPSGRLLGDRGRRALRLGHGLCAASAASLSSSSNSIGARRPAHVPFDVIGQHAQKHVRAHPIGQPVMHRTDLQIDRLDAAEGALHPGQGFIAAHGRPHRRGPRSAGWCARRRCHRSRPRRRFASVLRAKPKMRIGDRRDRNACASCAC